MNTLRRMVLAIVAIVAIVATVFCAAPRAHAQETDTTELTLVEHTPLVPANGTYRLVVHAPSTTANARLTVAVLPASQNDDEFNAVLAGRTARISGAGSLGQSISGLVSSFVNLNGDLEVFLATSVGPEPDAIRLPRPGVFPVLVTINEQGRPTAQLVTFIIRVDTAVSEPLRFTTIVGSTGAPVRQADGSLQVPAELRQIAATLAAAPDLRISVGLRPEAVAALANSADRSDQATAATIRDAVRNGEVITDTFVDIDPSAVAINGLGDEYRRQLELGRKAVSQWLAAPWVDVGVRFIDHPLSSSGRTILEQTGVRTVVSTSLINVPADQPMWLPVRDPATGFTLIATDPMLKSILDTNVTSDGSPDPQLDDRLIAYFAHRAFGQSSTARGVALVGSPDLPVSSVAALERVLPIVTSEATRLVRQATASEVSSLPPVAGRAFLRTAAPEPTLDGPAIGTLLGLIRTDLSVLASMVANPPADPDPTLTLAASTALSRAERRTYTTAAKAQWETLRTAVHPVARPRLTLTGSRSRLPIALESQVTQDVSVVLHISGLKLKQSVVVPVTVHNGVWRGNVPIEVLEGRSTVVVEVFTPIGDTVVASENIDIQVFALTGIGTTLTIGALGVLVSWWIRHHRRASSLRRCEAAHPSQLTADAAADK